MQIITKYKSRPIRFLEIINYREWKIKMYSISIHNEFVSTQNIRLAKDNLEVLFSKFNSYNLPTYGLATLIIHEGKEGCFFIMNWWIDENMLQNVVYLKVNKNSELVLFSENGICTCVWEMAIWWHERNAWVNHILMKNDNSNTTAYLQEQFNTDL